jgi:hypothetical protein
MIMMVWFDDMILGWYDDIWYDMIYGAYANMIWFDDDINDCICKVIYVKV